CLFQVRGNGTLVAAFPLTRPDDFNARPVLIGTYPADNRGLASHLRTAQGEWRAGDTLYLASDALAAWFVREHVAGRAPWKWFAALDAAAGSRDAAAFRRIVDDLRSDGRLANDDTTLAIVRMPGGEKG
ncbi:MAG TPA: hypothetical protein VM490_18985, partial [Armatimonadaceae bacterium]|nr:hypothetical protein [Armatimonadaceae bacterium]